MIDTRKSYKLGTRPPHYNLRNTYGGTIPWVGSHAVDWIVWFTEKSFVSVYATHSTKANADHGELEATAQCLFTLEDEITASLSIDYLRPDTAPTHGDDRIRVVGTRGVVEVADGKLALINADGFRQPEPVCERRIFVDFVNRVRGVDTGLVTDEETFSVTEACLKARESADTGKLVSF